MTSDEGTQPPGATRRAAPQVASWRRVDDAEGHSIGRVERTGTGWLAHGQEVMVAPEDTLGCSFAVELDDDWSTTHVIVTSVDRDAARALELRRDGTGHWWRDGERAPELDGCRDVDVAATPLTNTFPVNRLRDLEVGEQWTGPVAWVEVPTLRVVRVDQTYTRLEAPDDPDVAAAWEYKDDTHGAFRITTDAHGLVVDYEGFAERVRTTAGPARSA